MITKNRDRKVVLVSGFGVLLMQLSNFTTNLASFRKNLASRPAGSWVRSVRSKFRQTLMSRPSTQQQPNKRSFEAGRQPVKAAPPLGSFVAN